ncbi:hypothetical protein [Streptomyces luteocolor]|uniref:hypothetical protein n=1 Tax=Streptomyces luteocolor TaxID=285500 RepID=UPI000853CAA8|nr:hypothetical protein [Streptomyces luteocolor]
MTDTAPSPETCALCRRPIRAGEPTEELTVYVDGEPQLGRTHARTCPAVLLVWCAPCLRALLTGASGPHGCLLETSLGIDGARIVVIPETDCLCHCPPDGAVPPPAESEALRAARAEARRTTGCPELEAGRPQGASRPV